MIFGINSQNCMYLCNFYKPLMSLMLFRKNWPHFPQDRMEKWILAQFWFNEENITSHFWIDKRASMYKRLHTEDGVWWNSFFRLILRRGDYPGRQILKKNAFLRLKMCAFPVLKRVFRNNAVFTQKTRFFFVKIWTFLPVKTRCD